VERLRRSRHLSLFSKGEDVFAYHDLVGDIVRMDAKLVGFLDFFEEPREPSEARERFRADFEPADLDAFFEILPAHRLLVREGLDEKLALDWFHPMRGPWILLHEDTLGYVARSTDEVVLEKLDAFDQRVLRQCDGSRTVAEIAHEVGSSARDAIFRWTHSERQVLKLLEKPAREQKKLPPYAESTMPFARYERPGERTDRASTRAYHQHGIDSADEQFEVRETTLSHAFRTSHPALGGRTYAESLLAALEERGLLGERTRRIVEVGGGAGWFAKGALEALERGAPAASPGWTWTICDLAPELQRAQRDRTEAHGARVRFARGDAERLPFRAGSVDLLIANEMIADLEAVRLAKGSAAAEALAREHGVSFADAPEDFWVNAGALRFVREIGRVLAPGGGAVLTEFGELDRYPVESTHLDHREFSIHFGHLRAAAERAGLDARVELVPELLELDASVPVLATNRSFFRALRALLAERGVKLEKTAYTEEQFAALTQGKVDPRALEGLRLLPAGERVLGLRPREFKALLLRKRAPLPRRALEL
jgi:SAM-dependent methyltransferase